MGKRVDLIIKRFLENNFPVRVTEDDIFSTNRNGELAGIESFFELYSDYDTQFCKIFAFFHYHFNLLFEFWNEKTVSNNPEFGGHFNAIPSRDLISLIGKFEEIMNELKKTGEIIVVDDDYKKTIEKCIAVLEKSGGTPIPVGFGKIIIKKYDPIFSLQNTAVMLKNSGVMCQLTVVGAGSYALVKKYYDETYQKWFAVKQANKDLCDKELLRFKNEYLVLSKIKFPYILEVYTYNDENNSYTMEYCEHSLKNYVKKNNQKLSFTNRKKMALQFLYGVNFLYKKGYQHRDLSWNNVLVKEYDVGVAFVKISDFGLVRDPEQGFTANSSSGKGFTYNNDPLRTNFADLKIENEVYSVGCMLNFIFTGKESLERNKKLTTLNQIIDKCTDNHSLENRYHDIKSIIDELEDIELVGDT